MGILRLCAPAKVNLALHVGARRSDGYHEVRTVLQALALHDSIDLSPADDLQVHADDPEAGDGPANLAWRAADVLRRTAGVGAGARIRIRKRIPIRAGLGGGSSDAAAVLQGCNRLWGLRWPRQRLARLAAGLGADVPFFLFGGTAQGRGRGEDVTPLRRLPPWPALVCHPGPGVSTAEAYAALDALGTWPEVNVSDMAAACARPMESRSRAARRALGARMRNAFEAVVLPARPDIAALRRRLQEAGACAVLLCGSGAAVWALAPSAVWAQAQARALRAEGVWAVSTRLAAVRAGACGGRG